MTTETFPGTVGFGSIELATGADILKHENETIQIFAPLLNASTLYKSGSDVLTSTAYFTSSVPSVIAEINATASTADGESLTFHNATTASSNLTRLLTSSEPPVTRQQSSSRIIDFLTSESGHVGLDIETLDFESTTQHLEAAVADEQGSTVAIAVGVSVAVVVLVVSALIVIFVCLRRRRLPPRRKQSGPLMENPQYMERTSTLPKNFDLTMHTGPMMRDHLSSNSGGNTTKTNGKRKKDAPRPPIYKPTAGGDAKRKAPPPPEYPRDLLERDSGGAGSSLALELSSFGNQNANQVSADNESSQSKPLLESFHPQKKSPKRSSEVEPDEKADDVNTGNEDEADEDEEMKTTLLGKDKAESSLSLDSYDKTKNPFFSS